MENSRIEPFPNAESNLHRTKNYIAGNSYSVQIKSIPKVEGKINIKLEKERIDFSAKKYFADLRQNISDYAEVSG